MIRKFKNKQHIRTEAYILSSHVYHAVKYILPLDFYTQFMISYNNYLFEHSNFYTHILR